MRIPALAAGAVLVAALFQAPLAEAHHSNSAFYVDKVITIKGVVKELKWSNPHIWLYLTVDDGKGNKTEWSVEGRPPGILMRSGWTPKSLKPGETVTVDLSPAKDNTNSGLMARVTKEDGTILANAPPPTE
ncbi:MAG: hypothetical protein JOZ32_17330 [Bryobacterales bacterium]|nr:hypothetical protein [Bryobacterales bacterium]